VTVARVWLQRDDKAETKWSSMANRRPEYLRRKGYLDVWTYILQNSQTAFSDPIWFHHDLKIWPFDLKI